MSLSGHTMFAECFRDIRDDELIGEYGRVLNLPPSNWRTAVLREVEERHLALLRANKKTIEDMTNARIVKQDIIDRQNCTACNSSGI